VECNCAVPEELSRGLALVEELPAKGGVVLGADPRPDVPVLSAIALKCNRSRVAEVLCRRLPATAAGYRFRFREPREVSVQEILAKEQSSL
jgi:hypothetical protein